MIPSKRGNQETEEIISYKENPLKFSISIKKTRNSHTWDIEPDVSVVSFINNLLGFMRLWKIFEFPPWSN